MIRNININSIITGWSNWALGEIGMLDEKTKKLAESRFKICESCEFRLPTNICKICNCFLIAKCSDPNAKCPKLKW